MFNSKKTNELKRMLFNGSESDNMISAGVIRNIFADITRIYFENKKIRGAGVLVFNPENPEKSTFITKTEIENDLAIAEESCNSEFAEAFRKVLQVVEKEAESDLALVCMVYDDGLALNIINPDQINESIDKILKQANK